MDAATLYIVLTLPNGEQRTSTADFSTLWKCEQKIEWLKLIERGHPQLPGAVESYRCKEHKIRPGFYVIVYDWRGRPREHFGPSSRSGCTAYKWMVHMRYRSRVGRCYEWPRTQTNAVEPEREPNVPDSIDMLGQPGLPRPSGGSKDALYGCAVHCLRVRAGRWARQLFLTFP